MLRNLVVVLCGLVVATLAMAEPYPLAVVGSSHVLVPNEDRLYLVRRADSYRAGRW